MKVGFISDVHANFTALNKVMQHMTSDVDKIVCTGDIIGYGPRPSECLDVVRENCNIVVQGNHDRQVKNPKDYKHNPGAYKGLVHAKEKLSDEDIDWLSSLPEKEHFENYLIVHSHPLETDVYLYPEDFKYMGRYIEDYVGLVTGHTHKQHAEYIEDNKLVFNPGSVGQPRDGDSRAAYAILDTESHDIDLRRVEYDIDKTICKINECDLPDKSGQRLRQ